MFTCRCKESINGDYINASEILRIPPLTDIREFIAACSEIEKSEDENKLPEMRWIAQLVQPGSSLGGARPKASVITSVMTLLGLNNGDNANTGNGYLDIIDFILQNSTNVEDNLKELYRRVVFNICIGNTDDHFRNHGFLLTVKGCTFSPVYDMNPTLNGHQSLLNTILPINLI